MYRGDFIGFLYLVEEKEKNHNKNFFLKLFQKLRPKIKDGIYNNEGNKIGIISKINLKSIEDVQKLIYKINKIKEENTKYLIIENLNLFSREKLNLIENETNLKILNGMKIISCFFPLVLKELYIILNEDLKRKEVLIFCGSKELTEEFILNLSKEVKFITLVGDNKEIIEDISNNILESTGLSIFHSRNIEKILKNYPIIINLNDNTEINENKIRKEAIIFDFSLGKTFKSLKNCEIVEDFIFKIDGLNIKENSHMEYGLPSSLYEYFNKVEIEDLKGLLIKGQVYNPENFINGKIRQIRRL